MNKAPIRLGPLALLLTVISICLAILAIAASGKTVMEYPSATR